MQNIGPYELTTPGLTSTVTTTSKPTEVMQGSATYDATMPRPAPTSDNAAYVITQIGLTGTQSANASGQNAESATAESTPAGDTEVKKADSGWEENKIYAVND